MDYQETIRYVDELYESWYPQLLRYARRFLREPGIAEELVQETFLDLYRALLADQSIQFPKAWTMAVARRKILHDQRLRVLEDHRDPEDLSTLEISAPDWREDVEISIDCERVRDHMSLLSSREYEVLTLRLQSMRYSEIGGALGISTNSVKTLLARALEKLRRSFNTSTVAESDRRMERKAP